MIVLTYHSIQPKSKCKFMLTSAKFESHIKYFIKKGFNFIDLNSTSILPIGKKDILITIDDGYEDNYTYIYPILRKYKIPASIFIATNFIGKTMTLGGVELPMLKEEQINEMANSGLLHFASHTHNHIFFDELDDIDLVEKELKQSKKILKNIVGYESRYFVYPKGRFNEKYRNVLNQEFDYAFTGLACINAIKDNLKVPRIEIFHGDSKFKVFYKFNCIYKFKNKIKNIIARFSNKQNKLKKSNVAYMELSNICNAKCIFCPYPAIAGTDKKLQNMSFDSFTKNLKTIKELNYKRISFTPTTGEIFINKNWEKYVSLALNDYKIEEIYFYSNAILLNQDNIDKLIKLPNSHKIRRISFSIGGLDKKTYILMYGKDKFDVVVKNINNLNKSLKKINSSISISMEVRLPNNQKLKNNNAQTLLNLAKYKNFSISQLRSYDSLSKTLNHNNLTVNKIPKKDFIPCYHLKDIRVSALDEVWMCGCVISELPNDDSLKIKYNKIEDIAIMQDKTIKEWKEKNIIPSVCKDCSIYLGNDGL